MTATILSGGPVLTGNREGKVFARGAVAFEGERIVAVGAETAIFPAYPEARRLEAKGGLIVPGLINLHHHFYSAFARGLSPGVPTRDFEEVLRGLWWRLDRALDADAVRVSAALALADCVRWGCTTVLDHHSSPACVPGSLDLIAGEVRKAGISAVLCYEVTDRNGEAEALAGLEENVRFLLDGASDARVHGMVGLHAAFTLTDRTLAKVASRIPRGVGVHVKVGALLAHARERRLALGHGRADAGECRRLEDVRSDVPGQVSVVEPAQGHGLARAAVAGQAPVGPQVEPARHDAVHAPAPSGSYCARGLKSRRNWASQIWSW